MAAHHGPRPPDARSAALAVFLLILTATTGAAAFAGCADGGATARSSSPPRPAAIPSSPHPTLDFPPTSPSSPFPPSLGASAVAEPRVRTVGPGDNGKQVTIRVGDTLTVVPATRRQGWQVGRYPAPLLPLQGSTAPTASLSFLAVAVGEGQLTLVPAESGAAAADTFTLRVQVLRDLVQGPPL
jgi:hypothetical protein